MVPNYIYAESTSKPLSMEVCENTVYLRRGYSEKKHTTEQGNSITYWSYQEAKLTPEAFNVYVNFVMSKNAIDGEEDSSNITQLMLGQVTGENNQLVLMEALADLYEAVAETMML